MIVNGAHVSAVPVSGIAMDEVGGVTSVDCVAATRPDCKCRRLYSHVGEKVHGRLLHSRIDRRPGTIVSRVQSPRPLGSPCTENERPTAVAIKIR